MEENSFSRRTPERNVVMEEGMKTGRGTPRANRNPKARACATHK